ncbi:gliding motility lipoprotein GldH [Capnocytophaga sp.]|uniref:gliding motility lipoprotein GldH n=1 Tax=Capnocytophaga sp. TaxID=44737 RepID=UPI0026DB3E28|nr:gliding motility lipoprotein GldH [Capnocytophaga sp.]MDO5105681.1 gliding motility lipoprotein GldH [Capnocytophaga sp.]
MRIVQLLLVFIFFASCSTNVEYTEYVSISDGWNKSQPVVFQFEQDSLAQKNMFIMLRNNEAYPFSNLFVITRLEQPDNKVIIDTLQYEMATPDGTWLGYGYSAVKESKLWYKEKFSFPAKGKYTLRIEQAMRKIGENEGIEQLEGITEVGLRIETIN